MGIPAKVAKFAYYENVQLQLHLLIGCGVMETITNAARVHVASHSSTR